MIITITGKVGSGKTYYAVEYLTRKHYTYDDVIMTYVPRNNKLIVVTNIDKLELPHINLDREIERLGITGVFNEEYVRNGQFVFIIDEAQRYFDRKLFNKEIFYFFQMSRHYGVDIILITQDIYTLSRELRNLMEYEVRAHSRTSRTKNMFVYSWFVGDERYRKKMLKFDKNVGSLYRSQIKDETEKIVPSWRRYGIAGAVLIVFVGFFFFAAISRYSQPKTFGKGKGVTKEEQQLRKQIGQKEGKKDEGKEMENEKEYPKQEEINEDVIFYLQDGRLASVLDRTGKSVPKAINSNPYCNLSGYCKFKNLSMEVKEYCEKCEKNEIPAYNRQEILHEEEKENERKIIKTDSSAKRTTPRSERIAEMITVKPKDEKK